MTELEKTLDCLLLEAASQLKRQLVDEGEKLLARLRAKPPLPTSWRHRQHAPRALHRPVFRAGGYRCIRHWQRGSIK